MKIASPVLESSDTALRDSRPIIILTDIYSERIQGASGPLDYKTSMHTKEISTVRGSEMYRYSLYNAELFGLGVGRPPPIGSEGD